MPIKNYQILLIMINNNIYTHTHTEELLYNYKWSPYGQKSVVVVYRDRKRLGVVFDHQLLAV